ncbi:hypothetical protein JWG39_07995 [Desulforhopalus vacuolatus]|uniref:hypothetical protein n=1 Tax=Desulforhopalus vacuolatus TaxID=40414 RepID=UPI001962ECFD|nr:hypothetical protein [Desulforhopalus vacuolatus]MBM9519762.1 hypothetical protein [Desulforhopalus vacuolatus]
MNYNRIENQLDLNDPEGEFCFTFSKGQVELSFIDWKNKKQIISFGTVYLFLYRMANGYKNLPEAQVLEIMDSDDIRSLREDSTASLDEELHHFVISNNEDEWCEVIAARYELKMDG